MLPDSDRIICWTPELCREATAWLKSCVLISSDIETIPFKKPGKKPKDFPTVPLLAQQFYDKIPYIMTIACYTGIMESGEIRSFCFPFVTRKAVGPAPSHSDDVYKAVVEINASGIPFTGQNFTYDMAWFLRYQAPVANWAYDSMVMWWAIYPELPKRLDFIASILLDDYQYWKDGRTTKDFLEYCVYGMRDTESTLRITIILIERLTNNKRARINWINAQIRCMVALAMSVKGMKVNFDVLGEMQKELQAKADAALESTRYLIADDNFNPNSPKQKVQLFYSLLGARMRNAKGRFVSKLSQASAGKIPLRALMSDHPVFRRIAKSVLNSIEPAKQLSNVIGLVHMRSATGLYRFLTSYDGVGTTTSRLASRGSAFGHGGNAQNIRKLFRRFATADTDCVFMEVDYSAADDVFVSYESEEQKKIDLFLSGKDIHASNATLFFPNWTYEDIVAGHKADDPRVVDPITGIRQITKKVTHGCNYLMAGLTLLMNAGRDSIIAAAKELGHVNAGQWNQEQLVFFCGQLEAVYRGHYHRFVRAGADSWYQALKEEVKETEGFTTIFNYYQRFLGSPDDDKTLRAVAATAGQANTAGRINIAMNELAMGIRMRRFRDGIAPDADDPARRVSEATHGISMRQQTHDSIGFNIRYTHNNWRQGVEDILHVMRRPVVCKGRIILVNIEAEVSLAWAGKPKAIVESADDIQNFLDKHLAGNS